MSAVTLDEVKSYLRIAYNDDDTLLEKIIMPAAGEYLKAAIHENYDSGLSRAKLLYMLVVSDLYDKRDLNEGPSTKVRNIVDSFALQMRMQMRGETVWTPGD